MGNDVVRLTEEWFTTHDDGEFASGTRAHPYSVVPPATDAGRIVFTTKPSTVLAAIGQGKVADESGVIGRYGLPSRTDLDWISGMIARREFLFLGDMDPVDLMVFAWLRSGLSPKQVTFAGINDALLEAAGLSSTTTILIPLAPSEQQALTILRDVLPDLGDTVGVNCVRMLEQGRKIELEALGSSRTGMAAIARLVGVRKRAGGPPQRGGGATRRAGGRAAVEKSARSATRRKKSRKGHRNR